MSNLPDGVFAASLTPLASDLSIDTSRLVDHARWLLDAGCTGGVLLFGTTGEGLSLTASERIDALDAVLDAGLAPHRLLVGTGAAALPDVVQATAQATKRGVGGVLVLPPFHFSGITDNGVFAFYDRLIQRVGDPALRLYFYHHPNLTDVPISFPVIQKLIDAYPNLIAGIKDSTGEWDHTEALMRGFPDLQVFAGTERLLLPVLNAGGAGCISATVNVTAPLAGRIHRGWTGEQGGSDVDLEAMQATLSGLRGRLSRHPFIPALKQLWAWRSGTDAWTTMRPPLAPLPRRDHDTLQAVMADLPEAEK